MNISLSMILENLTNDGFEYFKHGGEGSDMIYSVQLFETDRTYYEPDVLYIVKISDLHKAISEYYPMNILCILDDLSISDSFKNQRINLIILNHACSEMIILNEIQGIINTFNKFSDRLLQALTQKRGLQYIIEVGHELLKNPILVMDITLKVLSYTKNDDFDDPGWKETTHQGYVSGNSTPFEELRVVSNKLGKSTKPMIFKQGSLNYPFIMSNIMIDNKTIGYLNIPGANKSLTEGDITLAANLSMFISLEMQKNEILRISKGIMYEYLIADLLEGKIHSNDETEHRLKFMDWHLKRNIFIFTITTKKNNITNEQLQYFRDDLMKIVFNSKSIIYNQTIVILVDHNKKAIFNNDEYDNIASFLKANQLHGGISHCFHNLSFVNKYYRQALKAIEIGSGTQKENVIFNYMDYMLNHFIDIMAEQLDIKDFCHPALLSLLDYDKDNDTFLTESLHTYLTNSQRHVATARALNIQRSSLLYRLGKIEKITNINLNDNDTIFHLQLSFRLLDYPNV